MIKKDGDRVMTSVVLTKKLAEYIDVRAKKMGLNKSAYIRLLIAKDAEECEKDLLALRIEGGGTCGC